MKKTTYFPHDYGARNDDKIIKLRAKFNNPWGYGLYWMFIESMHETRDGYIDANAIAELKLSFGLAENELEAFILFCIENGMFIRAHDGKITTSRVQEHKEFRKERSISGSKGGRSTQERSSATSSDSNQLVAIKEKKRKEKKINNKLFKAPSLQQVIDYCNETKSHIDPELFFHNYESSGWIKANGRPVLNWKSTVKTWEKKQPKPITSVKKEIPRNETLEKMNQWQNQRSGA